MATKEIVKSLPPHNIDAEEAVIGSILIDGDCLKELSLKSEDFYAEHLRFCFSACLALKERDIKVNEITLAEELDRISKLQAIGGAAYLSDLISKVPTSLDVEHYAKIVQHHSVNRKLISVGQNIVKLGMMAAPDVSVSLAKADEMLLDIRRQNTQLSIITPRDRAKMLNDRYETLYKAPQGVAYATGLHDLDIALGGGFYAGDLIIVGARPQVGKTTFLQSIANHVGKTKNVLFCSGEMDVASLSDRDVAGLSGYTLGQIRYGSYTPEMYAEITGAPLDELCKLKVYFYEEHKGFSTSQIYQAATQMYLRYGLDMIVIDYLGLLTDIYGQNTNDRYGYITRTLKELARSLHVPVLTAHQLNRAVEIREDKRPQLWDLRESGNIEQDADVVLFLYRESYYNRDENVSKETEIIIGKHRQGASNRLIKVMFDEKQWKYFGVRQD